MAVVSAARCWALASVKLLALGGRIRGPPFTAGDGRAFRWLELDAAERPPIVVSSAEEARRPEATTVPPLTAGLGPVVSSVDDVFLRGLGVGPGSFLVDIAIFQ